MHQSPLVQVAKSFAQTSHVPPTLNLWQRSTRLLAEQLPSQGYLRHNEEKTGALGSLNETNDIRMGAAAQCIKLCLQLLFWGVLPAQHLHGTLPSCHPMPHL